MLGVSVPGFDAATAQARTAALDALDAVGLRDLAGRLYVHLSGGERQRVHIARALSQLAAATIRPGETRCFLLDEPTSSLDLAHQSLVLAAIRRQARSGTAIVAVFHDLNLAAALADELVLLEKGRIMASGPAKDVLKDDLLSAAYGCRVLTNRDPQRRQRRLSCRRPSSLHRREIRENGTPRCIIPSLEIPGNTIAFELDHEL